MTGRLITFEGGEGAGKSTQSRLLAEVLRDRGIMADLTREPGGTTGAEAVRELILGAADDGWGTQAEALLFAAARADHVARRIRPALEAGTWIICDRFIDSSRAYQGVAGGVADGDLMELHRIGSGGLLPDLTILITLPAAAADERLARRAGGGADAIERRGADYHARVAEAFNRLAAMEPARFRVIDGSGTIEQTHAAIVAAVRPLMSEFS